MVMMIFLMMIIMLFMAIATMPMVITPRLSPCNGIG